MTRGNFVTVLALVAALLSGSCGAEEMTAQSVVRRSGVRAGLCVLVGLDDTRLAVALSRQNNFTVHCLYGDREAVAKARREIQSQGPYGRVSADGSPTGRLPYAENTVNLLVSDEGLSAEEVTRVLVPHGVALLRQANGKGASSAKWIKLVKPRPDNIDEWTHSLHGADGNAVADDEVAGPPRHLQWIEKPLWQRHHDLVPSITAMVTSGGRLFYINDEAPAGIHEEMPDQWFLTARDAFNGLLLWKRPISDWGWKQWNGDLQPRRDQRFNQPLHIARRLVAVADRVYVTLGFNAPLTALDAATGEILRTYPGTDFTDEVAYHDGTLILSVNQSTQKPGRTSDNPPEKKTVLAIDADTGRLLWRKGNFVGVSSRSNGLERITHLTPVVGGGGVYLLEEDAIVGLDLSSGDELWRTARLPMNNTVGAGRKFRYANACTLLYHDGAVLLAQIDFDGKNWPYREPVKTDLLAISAETGGTLWTYQCNNRGCYSECDVFAIGGLIWVHDVESFSLVGLDPSTGKVKRKFPTDKAFDQMHHHRCYRAKATSRYVLTARRGTEFLDMDSEHVNPHHWFRGTCRLGIMPANGLIYAPPHPCVCYITAKLNGLLALAPESKAESGKRKAEDVAPLERGPAYSPLSAFSFPLSKDWPTYRHDAKRSGSTGAVVPAELKLLWQADVGGRASGSVVTGGKVFVASVDSHRVDALDAATGKPLWSYTAGGRIDTPPTIYQDLALFGSADGWVYCLRASDGQLVWRRRAAPEDRRLVAFGQLESAWPVSGSVLVVDDIAYFDAGRSSFLDGGMYICAVEPRTGKLLQEKHIFSPDPETGEMIPCRYSYDMPAENPGALPDVLVSDGTSIYMRHMRFDPKDLSHGMAQPTATIATAKQRRGKASSKNSSYDGPIGHKRSEHLGLGPQLIASGGLLDDSWFNQTYWTVGQKSYSKLLVFEGKATYGVKVYKGTHRHQRSVFTPGKDGYKLFSFDTETNKERWAVKVPIRAVALLLAGDILFAAGPPDLVDPKDPWAAFEGKKGGRLWALSTADGSVLAKHDLPEPPIFDGMSAAAGRLYISTTGGKLLCLGQKRN